MTPRVVTWPGSRRSREADGDVIDDRVRRWRWLLVPGAFALAAVEWRSTTNADLRVLAVDTVAGVAFLAGAFLLLGRQSGRRVGVLSAAVGVAWFVGALSPLAVGLYLGPLGHLVVAYPTGHISRAAQRLVVGAIYVAGLLVAVAAVDVRSLALVAAAFVAVEGAVRARGALRRGRWSGAITGAVLAATAIATSLVVGQGWMRIELAEMAFAAALALAAIWLAIDLRWGGWSEDALTRLVIDLGDRIGPLTLRDRLADALDDPTLVLGYRRADGSGFVDDSGRPVAVPPPGSGRVVVPLIAADMEVGVLVRDEGFAPDPALADGVARAAVLALANARLNEATALQLDELDASRDRLIAAAESERRRIQGELRSGAMRRLDSVVDRLGSRPAEEPATRILGEVRAVAAQLDAFSRGLGASAALEAGLSAALRELVEHSPVPVAISVPARRWSSVVEETVYFVASEALTNIARHANASGARLTLVDIRTELTLTIEDDGRGGAAIAAGSGLEGMTLRVQASGGRLSIEDRRGGGTRLTATLPLDRTADLVAMAPTRRSR